MPFTLVAWYESTTEAKTTYAINAVADPHLRVSDDDIWVPSALPMLAGCIFMGANLTEARIESPTLRTLTPIDVLPFELAVKPSSNPKAVLQPAAPKTVGATEALNAKISAGAANKLCALAFLCDGPLAPVTGEIFTVKCSTKITTTPYSWTNAALVFTQSLPSGRYAIVGMRAKAGNLIAARLVISGFAWRPGCIGCQAFNDIERPEFRHGRMGTWGEFDHDVPPTVDFLSQATDTDPAVWLDLIKIA